MPYDMRCSLFAGTSICSLDATAQSSPPEAADALLLAPFLHHPSLKGFADRLELRNVSLYDGSFGSFCLFTSSLRRRFPYRPPHLNCDVLIVKPCREIFKNDGIVEQNLLPPARVPRIGSARNCFDGRSDLRGKLGIYFWPLLVGPSEFDRGSR
nr:hypothetical protein CFP56_52835 [Quercus suber]